jgi:hypothetical protein
VEVPFDRLELVLRLELEPGQGEGRLRASDDGSSTWVEALAEPDLGWGIFRARAELTVTKTVDDADGLILEDLAVELITDDYTANGWLYGARMSLLGAGHAELRERRDEHLSYWDVSAMPGLVLTDATGSIESEFSWISEAPSEATQPSVWLDTGSMFPSVYVHYVRFRRVEESP